MKRKLIAKYFILAFILSLVGLNLYSCLTKKDEITLLKSQVTSISQAKSYFARLNLWYSFAHSQDWVNAQKLENKLSPADLLSYRVQHDPIFIEKRAETISKKKDQTIEDWIELSKIYTLLGQPQNAIDALREARRIDPLRSDLESLEIGIRNN